MKCRLIAAGTRLPDWINSGFQDYQRRLRAPLELELLEIPIAKRRAGEHPRPAIAREGSAMLASIRREDYVVALEVGGNGMSTEQLSVWLARRMQEGRPLALLIGGPDGLAPLPGKKPGRSLAFGPQTWPHLLVRAMMAEQVYRALTILAGHPYHRA